MPLKVEPILPRFGAVCSGLDLTRKLTQEEVNDPIAETVYVNQLNIEEMDDKLIRLIKAP